MTQKKIAACIFLKDGRAVTDFSGKTFLTETSPGILAEEYDHAGADELVIFDLSEGDEEHEKALNMIRAIQRRVDIPIMGCGNVNRVEDVKKLLYAGCQKAVLNFSKESNIALTEEVSKRFGKNKIGISIDKPQEYMQNNELIAEYTSELLLLPGAAGLMKSPLSSEVVLCDFEKEVGELLPELSDILIDGIMGKPVAEPAELFLRVKQEAKKMGISVNTFESPLKWEDMKLNEDGLLPVVVQDHKNLEVLMVAYMNQEAFGETLATGRMTYYSRSRQELWTKGLTSGHFQYVKKLMIDCDNDTLLAQVAQTGAACHTGNRSCFYRTLVEKESPHVNPLKVLEEVYGVIEDRKLHPKEGSYTNYLFEKGIDKILKKVGEECTEIVIAAKNPNPEEIKYEIADFLYHCMVLMAEKGVTWEDITEELAHRR